MEAEQYDLMFRQEDRHWWYLGMRRIAATLLERYFHPDNVAPNILDAGCGSGGTTSWLGRWGRVYGIDLEPHALELAQQRGLRRLARASVQKIPFVDQSFDLITSFDVLYHLNVEDDMDALRELFRVTRPGGQLLIRVPAHNWLRGAHDRAVH